MATEPANDKGRRPRWWHKLRSSAGWQWWLAGALSGAAAALLITTLIGPAAAPRTSQQIEEIVKSTILANPELVPQAIDLLQQKEVTKLLASNRAAIETPFAGAWAGAKDGDVVLVEFFDFNCPFCRKSAADVTRLLADDPKLKVVYRDMPVLGPESERFAHASLAAAQQGRYRQFYDRVFAGQGSLSEQRLIGAVRAAGLDETRTASDMQSAVISKEIDNNLALARALGLTGTPSFVVGDQILAGAVGYDALKAAVAKARESAT